MVTKKKKKNRATGRVISDTLHALQQLKSRGAIVFCSQSVAAHGGDSLLVVFMEVSVRGCCIQGSGTARINLP